VYSTGTSVVGIYHCFLSFLFYSNSLMDSFKYLLINTRDFRVNYRFKVQQQQTVTLKVELDAR